MSHGAGLRGFRRGADGMAGTETETHRGEHAAGWLSLGRASRLIGVNETTLRRWADEGRVRSYRTPGGHRRFSEQDIRALLRADAPPRDPAGRLSDLAIPRIRRRLQARPAHAAPWNQEIDEHVRLRLRLLGRRLVSLIDEHIGSGMTGGRPSGRRVRARLLEEARALGAEYGRELAAGRLPLSSTVQAFTFFRRSLDETTEQLTARHGLTAEQAAEAREHLAEVVDTVLIAITRAYENRVTNGH